MTTVAEQLAADAQALRAEAGALKDQFDAKIAQAEALERHVATGIGAWLSKELGELKTAIAAIPAEVREIPAELHTWIANHV